LGLLGRYQPFLFRGFWQQLKFTISIFVLYSKGMLAGINAGLASKEIDMT